MVKKTIGQRFRDACLLIPASIALSGIAVLAYQSYSWMKQGHWKPIGSRLVLDKVVPVSFFEWVDNPNSWSGLNKIVSSVFDSSLALFLLVSGLVVLLLISKTLDFFSKPAKKEQTTSWRGR